MNPYQRQPFTIIAPTSQGVHQGRSTAGGSTVDPASRGAARASAAGGERGRDQSGRHQGETLTWFDRLTSL